MKIVRIIGGIGNQMFQYAYYKSLSKRFKDVQADTNGFNSYRLHNGFELEQVFNIKLNTINPFATQLYSSPDWFYRKLRRLLNLKGVYEEERSLFSFDQTVFDNENNKYYSGYWQNEQYFKDIEYELRQDFQFKKPLEDQNAEIIKTIKESNSVCLHVRRGDYAKDPLLGGLCGLAYYQKAVELMQSKNSGSKFFIFSDDINWCRKNISLNDSHYISWNTGSNSYVDMQLMSTCKHNIIANSSFSWWGAWLNNNPEKIVIGPEKWVNNEELDTSTLLPHSWLRV